MLLLHEVTTGDFATTRVDATPTMMPARRSSANENGWTDDIAQVVVEDVRPVRER